LLVNTRHETDLESWDRRLLELLQEIRVAQTGGQILFAFLLTLPFSARFAEVNSLERTVYILTLCFAATSMALLIAPVAYHRQVFRQGLKPRLVQTASVLAQAGLVALLLAIIGAVFLVLDVVAGLTWAAVVAAIVAGIYVLLWYVLPVFDALRHSPNIASAEAASNGPPSRTRPSTPSRSQHSGR
jgi:O-antigen/teichoic acid export membrane protein